MEYHAHRDEEDTNRVQSIEEHSEGVSALAESFSVDMFKSICYETARIHDIGKYCKAFQDRLNGNKNIKYEHSLCGAIEYAKLVHNEFDGVMMPMVQFCIACHHTGLQDGNNLKQRLEDKASGYYVKNRDYSEYKEHIQLKIPNTDVIFRELASAKNAEDLTELYAFFTRYVFSCLTDADFLDTEKFYKLDVDRNLKCNFVDASKKIEDKFNSFIEDTPVKSARNRLQHQAFENAKAHSNVSILNMPTGSGKTLCSLKIAMDKVVNSADGKKRIIYVIPYTSIIEQTADEFKEILGEDLDILQHHSNYTFDVDNIQDEESRTTEEKLKLACENWDAPLVITTSVQFFQSLYHYRGSKLRKLHNLADSVIIFDEIHTLPMEYLQPCLRAVGYVTKYLNSEAIFLSATMPNYDELFMRYLPNVKVNNLITDKTDFKCFKNRRYVNIGKTSLENIISKTDEYQSSLIILNTRKSVKEAYNEIKENGYCLSTYMTPEDRSKTIQNIKDALSKGEKVTVVSTSLVEAGVDLDFQAVFRELSGLDSILQSGGRCNREGQKDNNSVYIFETENHTALRGDMSARVEITRRLFEDYEDITSDECIEDYYNTLFKFKDDSIQSNSMYRYVCSRHDDICNVNNIEFRSYAENFNLIKDDSIALIIDNNQRTHELIEALSSRKFSVKRKLQRYAVSLRIGDFKKAFDEGLIKEIEGVFVLSDSVYYREDVGLDLDFNYDSIVG